MICKKGRKPIECHICTNTCHIICDNTMPTNARHQAAVWKCQNYVNAEGNTKRRVAKWADGTGGSEYVAFVRCTFVCVFVIYLSMVPGGLSVPETQTRGLFLVVVMLRWFLSLSLSDFGFWILVFLLSGLCECACACACACASVSLARGLGLSVVCLVASSSLTDRGTFSLYGT